MESEGTVTRHPPGYTAYMTTLYLRRVPPNLSVDHTYNCCGLYAIGWRFQYHAVRPHSNQTVAVRGDPRFPIRKSFIYSPVVYCTHVQ